MPNRGDLRFPAERVARAETLPAADQAWTVIGFCAVGLLMTIYFAVATVGVDAVPRLMQQFPGAM